MKKRVCLLLSDRMLSEVISDYLIKNEYDVSQCACGNLNMAIYLAQEPDVIMLSAEDKERLQTFFTHLDPEDRESISKVPIILLSPAANELHVTNAAVKFELRPSE